MMNLIMEKQLLSQSDLCIFSTPERASSLNGADLVHAVQIELPEHRSAKPVL